MTIDFMVPHATKMVHFARARKGDFLKVFRAEEATPIQNSITRILLEQPGAASTILPGEAAREPASGADVFLGSLKSERSHSILEQEVKAVGLYGV
ncbi:hypothetical protein ACQU0X_31970 [Pseudovibrio ascidiaceicola]|uniref:hypothetical protein n=1 Tax=Pseudovibrio ascidiaceicola TaxID=285279 RepID=UPI003D3624FF